MEQNNLLLIQLSKHFINFQSFLSRTEFSLMSYYVNEKKKKVILKV